MRCIQLLQSAVAAAVLCVPLTAGYAVASPAHPAAPLKVGPGLSSLNVANTAAADRTAAQSLPRTVQSLAQASESQPAGSSFAGVWEGTTLANCANSRPGRCNAQQKVTITLLQGTDSKWRGKYKCAYGNKVCYNLNETGNVASVTLNGKRMTIRVIMPDGSSCMFTGLNLNRAVNGGYSCYQGASRIEQGWWRARQSY